MFLGAAEAFANSILEVLGKHREGIARAKKVKEPISTETRAIFAALEPENQYLKGLVHSFASTCRQDRASTQHLAWQLNRKLSAVHGKAESALDKLKTRFPVDQPERFIYLLDLEKLLLNCLNQLNLELFLGLFVPYPAAPLNAHSPQFSGGNLGIPIADSAAAALFPTGSSLCGTPSGNPLSQAGPHPEPQPQPTPPAKLQPEEPPMAILSKLSEEPQGQNLESLLLQLLEQLKKQVTHPSKKKGRPGKNSQLSFHELLHLVLMCNLDLLLIKLLGSKRTYDFLALFGGGNEKDAAGFLRDYRKAQDDLSRDPKYNLKGRHQELEERARKIIGTRLPQAVLALVQK